MGRKIEKTQTVMHAMIQAATKAMEAAVQAMSKVVGPAEGTNGKAIAASMIIRASEPSLKQPTFNRKAQDKYNKLLNFEIEVKIFS